MTNQQILKNEDMTNEEFIILCATLTGNEKKFIINPKHPLEAKFELTSLKKRPDFFEFAINNFTKMHHPISTDVLINHIYYTLQVTTISFDLYDNLIDHFFQNLSSWLMDKDYPICFKVQVKLFVLLYDLDFWKQLFVCEDCSTYMLKNPENQVLGFMNCLGTYLQNERKRSTQLIQNMMNDHVFDIFFQYLFDKYNNGHPNAINIITLFISILDYSYVINLPMISNFLKQLQNESDPIDAIKYLLAIFTTNSYDKEIDISQKMNIVESFNEINLFETFRSYLDNQLTKLKAGVPVTTIQTFSRLISEMMKCLLLHLNANEDEIELLKPFFSHYSEIFFKTIICLSELPYEYLLFILSLMNIIPEQGEDVLYILLEKFGFISGKYQIISEAGIIASNYLELFLRLIYKFHFDKNQYFGQVFEKIGVDDHNLIGFFFSILEILISREGQIKQENRFYYDSIPTFLQNFVVETVAFYLFILKPDFRTTDDKQYFNLIKSYSYLLFSVIDDIPVDQQFPLLSSLFFISQHHYQYLGEILSELIEHRFDCIRNFTNLTELSISLMSSMRPGLIKIGMVLASKLHHRQELTLQALDSITNQIKNEEGVSFTFSVLKPLFMNLENISKNKNSPDIVEKELQLREFMMFLLDLIKQKQSEPKRPNIEDSDDEIDYSEWSAINGLEDNFPNWLEAYLHVFGFSEYVIVHPIILDTINVSQDVDSTDNDIALDSLSIIAKELALDLPAEPTQELDSVNEIISLYTSRFLAYFDFSQRGYDEHQFCYTVLYGSVPYLDKAYINFGRNAIYYFIKVLTTFFIPPLFESSLPLFKFAVQYPIIDDEKLLDSLLKFASRRIEDELEFFVEQSKRLILFYLKEENARKLLPPIGCFHRELLPHEQKAIFLQKSGFPDQYLKALGRIPLENDSKAFIEAIKIFFHL